MTITVRVARAALAAALGLAGGAHAVDLVAQPPQTAALNGLQADNSTGSLTQTFSAPAQSVLESIIWWGFHGSNSEGSAFDQFAVYLNDARQTGTLTSTSVVLADHSVLTRYTLDLVDMPLTATSLSIVNDSLDVEWFWQYSSLNGPNPESLGFALSGSLVPEPATYVLLLAGIAAGAGASRRGRTR